MSERDPFDINFQSSGTQQNNLISNNLYFDEVNMNANDNNNNTGIEPNNEKLEGTENLHNLNDNSSFYNEQYIYNLDLFYDDEEKAREISKIFYSFSFDKENEKSVKTTKYITNENKSKIEINESTKDLNNENQNVKKESNSNKKSKINKINSNYLFKVLKIKRYLSEDISIKIGNSLQIKSLRKDNIRNKIIRNFIQDIIPNWVGNIKTKKKDKLNRDDLIFNYKKKLKMKLSEIYKDQFDSNEKDKVIDVKLEFNLKEAFLYLINCKMRESILSSVLTRLKMSLNNFKEDDFSFEFDKQKYIQQKSDDYKESDQYNKAFTSIIEDISSSNE